MIFAVLIGMKTFHDSPYAEGKVDHKPFPVIPFQVSNVFDFRLDADAGQRLLHLLHTPRRPLVSGRPPFFFPVFVRPLYSIRLLPSAFGLQTGQGGMMAVLVLIVFQAADLILKFPDLLIQFDDFLFRGIGTRFVKPGFLFRIRKHRFISLFDLMELSRPLFGLRAAHCHLPGWLVPQMPRQF